MLINSSNFVNQTSISNKSIDRKNNHAALSSKSFQHGKLQSNSNVSFSGLNVKSILSKFLSPFRNITTEKVAINKLKNMELGAYIRNEKGLFDFVSPEEFQNMKIKPKEVILKDPIYKFKPSSDNLSLAYFPVGYKGISPNRVIDATKAGIEKLTMVTDKEIHVLFISKNDEIRQKALQYFKSSPELKQYRDIKNDPNYTPEYMVNSSYELAKEMLHKGFEEHALLRSKDL